MKRFQSPKSEPPCTPPKSHGGWGILSGKNKSFRACGLTYLFAALLLLIHPAIISAGEMKVLQTLIGKNDSVIVADPQGNILIEKNSTHKRIPASTLKILTSLAVMHYLGPDYRFYTDFYLDPKNNLKVKGYGDPLLISEVIDDIARKLSEKLTACHDLLLDDSYFQHPIIIPGVTDSFQPYDAPNGALCVNFNTVYFRRLKFGTYISAEPQTPLLPFVLPRIKASALKSERIILSVNNKENIYYTGHLLNFFLNQNGIRSTGEIKLSEVDPVHDRLILRYVSPYPLEQVVRKLLEFSNNYIANQIMIACGADRYGTPGTLPKGTRVLSSYLRDTFHVKEIDFAEGSGISRDNRMSAKTLLKVLDKFTPYHHLLRKKEREYYKTGNLTGVSTRAGYIENDKGDLYRFVVFINSPGKSTRPVMDYIHDLITLSAD
ncbi:D-alanyl-D-alanine carboxypeptidase/D-alanyl-D-alanine-endopeptidase [Thermodesulfobacteriota bacterium]